MQNDDKADDRSFSCPAPVPSAGCAGAVLASTSATMSDRQKQQLTARVSESSLLEDFGSGRKMLRVRGKDDHYDDGRVLCGGAESSVKYARPRALSLDDVLNGANEHYRLRRISPDTTRPPSPPSATRVATSTSGRSRLIQYPLANMPRRREPVDSPRPTLSLPVSRSLSSLEDKGIDIDVGRCESTEQDHDVEGLFTLKDYTSTTGDKTSTRLQTPLALKTGVPQKHVKPYRFFCALEERTQGQYSDPSELQAPAPPGTTYTTPFHQAIGDANEGGVTDEQHNDDGLRLCVTEPIVCHRQQLPEYQLSFDRGQPVQGGSYLKFDHHGTLKGRSETTGAVHVALPKTESDLGVGYDETDGTHRITATSLSQALVLSKLPIQCSPHRSLSSRLLATSSSSIAGKARVVLGGSTTGLAGVDRGAMVTEAWAEPGEAENMDTTLATITCTGSDAVAEFPRCNPQDHETFILREGNATEGDARVIESGEHCLGKEATVSTAAGAELARSGVGKQKTLAAEDNSTRCPTGVEDWTAPRQLSFTANSLPTPSFRRQNYEPRRALQRNESVDNDVRLDEGRNAVGGRCVYPRESTRKGDNHESLRVPECRETFINSTESEIQVEASRGGFFTRGLPSSVRDIGRREDKGFESPHASEGLSATCVTTARRNGIKHLRPVIHGESCTTTYESGAGYNYGSSGNGTPGSLKGPSTLPEIAGSTRNSPPNFDAEADMGTSPSEGLEELDARVNSAHSTITRQNDGRCFTPPVDDDVNDDTDDNRAQYLEYYRTMDFVARQELEQLVADRKREGRQRAEEERCRDLASSGRWMNRTSRVILARASRVGAPQGGNVKSGNRQSVFERLASRTRGEGTFLAAEEGAPEYGYPHEGWVLRSELDGYKRQPFKPIISQRSNLLASRMTDRNDERSLCERLYREGKGKLRKWERRIDLADQALRDKAAASYVRPVSERILSRRFRSTLMKALSVVDAEQRGWLSLSDLERVLRECGMLHSENHRENPDDVLRAVWGALSKEIETGGTYSRQSSSLNANVCGVSVDRLSAVLTTVASGRHGRDTSENEPIDLGQHPACKNGLSSTVSRSASRGWHGGEWGWGKKQPRAPVANGELADDRCKGDIADLCKHLRDIFETNKRFGRAGKSKRWSEGRARGSSVCDAMSKLEAEGIADTRRDIPLGHIPGATRAQVAAMTSRFEEKARARERKIELLRQTEDARETALHTFEPFMVATPEGLYLRRKAATLARQPDTSVGGGLSTKTAVPCRDRAQSYQQVEPVLRQRQRNILNHRTSEDRKVDDKCTFRPQLFKPLAPKPPRRHLSEDAARGEVATTTTLERYRVTCTSFWNTQVERLKTGRAKRLRRLETENSTAPRSGPLPPSIQELLIDEGMQPQDHSRIPKHDAQEGASKSNRSPAAPPRLCLERRLRARHKWERERFQEKIRKQEEEDIQREKRKRVLVRASRRAAANVGLEAALNVREAETGRWDPPMLIVEIEFVPQARWVLLPLWMNTCISGAAGELNNQEPMSDTVATELELLLRNEMERARSSLGNEQAGDRKMGRKLERGNRQAISTVLLRVDTADGSHLRDCRTADSVFPVY